MPLPELCAAGRIEGDDPAVGFAADVAGAAGNSHLVGGDRHEQAIVVKADGAGDHRGFVDARGLLPDSFQRVRIECVDGGHGIGEHQQFFAAAQGCHGDRRANAAEHFGVPANATALAVDGVDLAGLVAEIHRVADDGRLGTHIGDFGKCQAPGQFEAGHIVAVDTRRGRRHEATVGVTEAPVGDVFFAVIGRRDVAAVLGDPVICRCRAGEVDGDQATLLLAEVGGHGLHLAELQRHHHGLLGKAGQGFPAGGVHGRIVVAAGAVLVEQFFPEIGQWQFIGVADGEGFQGFHGRVTEQQATADQQHDSEQQQAEQAQYLPHGFISPVSGLSVCRSEFNQRPPGWCTQALSISFHSATSEHGISRGLKADCSARPS